MPINEKRVDEDTKKAQAFYKLFRERTFLGEIEIEFEKEGREIVRKAVRVTATGVLLVLFFIPLLFVISPYPFASLIIIQIFCMVAVFLIPALYFKHDHLNYEEQIRWIKDKLKTKTFGFRFLWYYPVLITPFSIRTVWLWTLIFGFFRAVQESVLNVNCNFT